MASFLVNAVFREAAGTACLLQTVPVAFPCAPEWRD